MAVALIVGAGSGLSASLAHLLAKEGFKIALVECLTSLDEDVRSKAQSALNELVSPNHLLQLLDALYRDDFYLQLTVLGLLQRIHDAQALSYILPFFQSERSELAISAIQPRSI